MTYCEVDFSTQIQNQARGYQPWGVSVSVDLYQCNPEIIRDADAIKRFVAELIKCIDMKAFGPCHVVHFGEDERVAGYSMFQLIETSCISGHFANQSNNAYIDIFSCKPFSTEDAASFCQNFFEADHTRINRHDRV